MNPHRPPKPAVHIVIPIEGEPELWLEYDHLDEAARALAWIDSRPDLLQLVQLARSIRGMRRAA